MAQRRSQEIRNYEKKLSDYFHNKFWQTENHILKYADFMIDLSELLPEQQAYLEKKLDKIQTKNFHDPIAALKYYLSDDPGLFKLIKIRIYLPQLEKNVKPEFAESIKNVFGLNKGSNDLLIDLPALIDVSAEKFKKIDDDHEVESEKKKQGMLQQQFIANIIETQLIDSDLLYEVLENLQIATLDDIEKLKKHKDVEKLEDISELKTMNNIDDIILLSKLNQKANTLFNEISNQLTQVKMGKESDTIVQLQSLFKLKDYKEAVYLHTLYKHNRKADFLNALATLNTDVIDLSEYKKLKNDAATHLKKHIEQKVQSFNVKDKTQLIKNIEVAKPMAVEDIATNVLSQVSSKVDSEVLHSIDNFVSTEINQMIKPIFGSVAQSALMLRSIFLFGPKNKEEILLAAAIPVSMGITFLSTLLKQSELIAKIPGHGDQFMGVMSLIMSQLQYIQRFQSQIKNAQDKREAYKNMRLELIKKFEEAKNNNVIDNHVFKQIQNQLNSLFDDVILANAKIKILHDQNIANISRSIICQTLGTLSAVNPAFSVMSTAISQAVDHLVMPWIEDRTKLMHNLANKTVNITLNDVDILGSKLIREMSYARQVNSEIRNLHTTKFEFNIAPPNIQFKQTTPKKSAVEMLKGISGKYRMTIDFPYPITLSKASKLQEHSITAWMKSDQAVFDDKEARFAIESLMKEGRYIISSAKTLSYFLLMLNEKIQREPNFYPPNIENLDTLINQLYNQVQELLTALNTMKEKLTLTGHADLIEKYKLNEFTAKTELRLGIKNVPTHEIPNSALLIKKANIEGMTRLWTYQKPLNINTFSNMNEERKKSGIIAQGKFLNNWLIAFNQILDTQDNKKNLLNLTQNVDVLLNEIIDYKSKAKANNVVIDEHLENNITSFFAKINKENRDKTPVVHDEKSVLNDNEKKLKLPGRKSDIQANEVEVPLVRHTSEFLGMRYKGLTKYSKQMTSVGIAAQLVKQMRVDIQSKDKGTNVVFQLSAIKLNTNKIMNYILDTAEQSEQQNILTLRVNYLRKLELAVIGLNKELRVMDEISRKIKEDMFKELSQKNPSSFTGKKKDLLLRLTSNPDPLTMPLSVLQSHLKTFSPESKLANANFQIEEYVDQTLSQYNKLKAVLDVINKSKIKYKMSEPNKYIKSFKKGMFSATKFVGGKFIDWIGKKRLKNLMKKIDKNKDLSRSFVTKVEATAKNEKDYTEHFFNKAASDYAINQPSVSSKSSPTSSNKEQGINKQVESQNEQKPINDPKHPTTHMLSYENIKPILLAGYNGKNIENMKAWQKVFAWFIEHKDILKETTVFKRELKGEQQKIVASQQFIKDVLDSSLDYLNKSVTQMKINTAVNTTFGHSKPLEQSPLMEQNFKDVCDKLTSYAYQHEKELKQKNVDQHKSQEEPKSIIATLLDILKKILIDLNIIDDKMLKRSKDMPQSSTGMTDLKSNENVQHESSNKRDKSHSPEMTILYQKMNADIKNIESYVSKLANSSNNKVTPESIDNITSFLSKEQERVDYFKQPENSKHLSRSTVTLFHSLDHNINQAKKIVNDLNNEPEKTTKLKK